MKKIILLIGVLFSVSLNATDLSQPQISFSFQVLKDKKPVTGTVMTIASQHKGVVRAGDSVGHARLSCVGPQVKLESIILFDGVVLTHWIEGSEIVAEVTKTDVSDQDSEISALREGQCKDLGPSQNIAVQKTVRIPLKATRDSEIPLGEGYSLRYGIAPLIGVSNS